MYWQRMNRQKTRKKKQKQSATLNRLQQADTAPLLLLQLLRPVLQLQPQGRARARQARHLHLQANLPVLQIQEVPVHLVIPRAQNPAAPPMQAKLAVQKPAIRMPARKVEAILHRAARESKAKQIQTSKTLQETTRNRTVEMQNLDPARTLAVKEKAPETREKAPVEKAKALAVKAKALAVKAKALAVKAKALAAKAESLEEVPQVDRKAPRSILRSSALFLRSQARSPMKMELTPMKAIRRCRKPYPAL